MDIKVAQWAKITKLFVYGFQQPDLICLLERMFSFNKLLDHKGFSGLDFYLALTPKTWEPGRKLTITLSASMHINHLSQQYHHKKKKK